jgi:exopolysaccharide production protein ExoQ
MSSFYPLRNITAEYDGSGSNPALVHQAESEVKLSRAPIHQQVVNWLLMLPLLNMVAKGSLSFLSPPATAFNYQNAYLANTAPGIRPQVVINLLLLGTFALAGNRKVWRVLIENRLLLMSLVFAAVSVLWSEAPVLTLRMAVEVTLTTLFACYLNAKMSTERLMNLLMLLGLVAAGLSVILVIFKPQYGIFQGYAGGAWQGISTHKNTLGLSMAFLLTPVFFVKKPIAVKIGYAAPLFFLVVMSQSRGAWLETAGMLLFVAWLATFRRLNSKESLAFAMVTITVGIGVVVFGVTHSAMFAAFLGKDPTLTGRTVIYSAVLESIFKHPLLGYGFGAFWKFNPESLNIALSVNWINIGYAENGLLDLWLQVGAVGVGLVVLMFAKAIRQATKLIRSQYYTPRVGWFSSVIVLELLANVAGGWLMAGSAIDWLLTLVACLGLANEVRSINTSRRDTAMDLALSSEC